MGRKQGPPEPISEAKFAKLKRKAGLPVDSPSEPPTKKSRRARKRAQGSNGIATKKLLEKKTKGANGVGKAKTQNSDPEGEEFEGLSGEDDDPLKDNFLGSDSSVYDSEDEQRPREHLFSEDEDESDAEQ